MWPHIRVDTFTFVFNAIFWLNLRWQRHDEGSTNSSSSNVHYIVNPLLTWTHLYIEHLSSKLPSSLFIVLSTCFSLNPIERNLVDPRWIRLNDKYSESSGAVGYKFSFDFHSLLNTVSPLLTKPILVFDDDDAPTFQCRYSFPQNSSRFHFHWFRWIQSVVVAINPLPIFPILIISFIHFFCQTFLRYSKLEIESLLTKSIPCDQNHHFRVTRWCSAFCSSLHCQFVADHNSSMPILRFPISFEW